MGVLDHTAHIFSEVVHSTWYIGVFCALVASFVGALGDNVVRLSFLREERRQRKIVRPYYKRPLWVFGEFLTIVCNPALTLAALKFSAASIVVPFGGLHIFWNVCLCGYLLRERLSRAEIFGSLVILMGIVLVVFFGTHEIPEYSVDRLITLMKQPMFIFYSVVAAFSIGFCWYFGNVEVIGTIQDMFYARVDVLNKSARNLSKHFLHVCRYEAKFVVPMVNACLVASGSTGGILFFQEYGDLSELDVLFFSIGVSSVIGGIFILMKGDQMISVDDQAVIDDER
ncbi:hypothetical protein IE077_000807 [Cardiosporidium cionae]|uniref:Magnesium transporter n=1 Tax=Cardiosporidium cionae TaxID=476202 RepID=A0ABQ7J6F4_9APIC|nr:hypothetical protein IE077_000807 [Cardiosporidium cionae]|eukprot:KAF8819575.1 hypothetical protein IE077_000807 [Cardiosporidium cionae]